MRHWTEEEKQRQREMIRSWQPWKKSTGAKTAEGKARSSRNALKHGVYTKEMDIYRMYLRHARMLLTSVNRFLRSPESFRLPEQQGPDKPVYFSTPSATHHPPSAVGLTL